VNTEPSSAAEAADGKQRAAITFLDRAATKEGSFTFDYGVPTSPALTLTGLSPDKITTSTSLKPFVLAIPNLFSEDGARSLAFDASPGQLLTPLRQQRYSRYVDPGQQAHRVGFRTRIGLAVDKGQSGGEDDEKSAPSKLGLGLSTSLLDSSDPLMATDDAGNRIWETCVAANIGALPNTVPQTESGLTRTGLASDIAVAVALRLGAAPVGQRTLTHAVREDIKRIEAKLTRLGTPVPVPDYNSPAFDTWLSAAEAILSAKLASLPADSPPDDPEFAVRTAALKACAVKASERAQSAQDLDLGFGSVWSGDEGELANFGDAAPVLWAAYKLPLRSLLGRQQGSPPVSAVAAEVVKLLQFWSVGASARYAWSDKLATADESTPEVVADVRDLWIGVERLTSSSRFAAQYGWFDAQATESESQAFSRSGERWLVSGAYRVSSLEQGVWLTFSYGKAESTLEGFDDEVALISIVFSPPTLSSMFAQ